MAEPRDRSPDDEKREEQDPSEVDRGWILRRRALFIASAIAQIGVGCGDSGPPPEPSSPQPCLKMASTAAMVSQSASSKTSEPPAVVSGARPSDSASAGSSASGSASSSGSSQPPPQPCLRVAPKPHPKPKPPPPDVCLFFLPKSRR
ncbi:MAG: hypothetical protein U0271_29800 [Polyangiaceae bacterium]